MPLTIATWNINGTRARLPTVTAWLAERSPDVACLQEIKCEDDAFPAAVFEDLGYNVAVCGQRSFNGVAILSKLPIDDIACGLPGNDTDHQARYIEAVVSAGAGAFRVASVYLPNGNPAGTDKYSYKLAWMERLAAHAERLMRLEEPLVLAGDYNVIPTAADVYDPAAWTDDALFLPETRSRFRALLHLGLRDAFRTCSVDAGQYTFWDYQAGAWQRNRGIRIDHALVSPQAADRLITVTIDKAARGRERPSDHVPVVATFSDGD